MGNLGGYALGRTYCLAGTYCAPFVRNLSPRTAPLFALLQHPLLCAVHFRRHLILAVGDCCSFPELLLRLLALLLLTYLYAGC